MTRLTDDSGFAQVQALNRRKAANVQLRQAELAQLREWLRSTPGVQSTLHISSTLRVRADAANAKVQSGTLDKINALEAQFNAHWHHSGGPASQSAQDKTIERSVVARKSDERAGAPNGDLSSPRWSCDPRWHAVALSFAQGDDAACERDIRALEAALGAQAVHTGLFALYIAMGRRDQHESLALLHATRCNTSAPEWPAWARDVTSTNAPIDPSSAWCSPPILSADDAAAIAPSVDRWDWRPLRDLTLEACVALQRHWQRAMRANAVTVFVGMERLQAALARAQEAAHDRVTSTPEAERHIWDAQLMLKRWLGDQAAFEKMSLDYCVRFEVSPPDVIAPRKTLRVDDEPVPDDLPNAGDGCDEKDGVLLLRGNPPRDALREALSNDEAKLNNIRQIDATRLLRLDVAGAQLLGAWANRHRVAHGTRPVFVNGHWLVLAVLDLVGATAYLDVRSNRHNDA